MAIPLIEPATKLRAVTPDDSTEIYFRSLWIGGAGNVAVLAKDDSSAVTLPGAAAGSVIPIEGRKVLSTGTTATNIVAMS